MDKIDATIGKSIRHYRWLQGISQTDLANALGISLAQLRSHEAGKSRVSAARLMAIAGHLGVEVTAFFQRNPDKPFPVVEPAPAKARGAADAMQNGKYLAALMTHFQRLNESQKQAVLQLVVSISKEGGGVALPSGDRADGPSNSNSTGRTSRVLQSVGAFSLAKGGRGGSD